LKASQQLSISKCITGLLLVPVFLFFSNAYAQREAVIALDTTHQRIRGFGGANILPWRPDMTDSEIETAFGIEDGQLGLSILRLMIDPVINNWNLNLHTARMARDMGVLIFASPWNAPSSMLEIINGQRRVRHDKYEDYAYHLDDFNFFMEDNGIPLYAISVQNEPDYGDWTRWTDQDMYTFMRDYASIINNRVIAAESFQFRHEITDPILNDPVACANLDIVGGHLYGDGLAPYPLAESKGKEVWMTEHWSDGENNGNDWPLALNIGAEINSCMHDGMHAYVLWYIVRYYGLISDGTNNSGSKGDVTKRGYVMSQFARFIRPGYLMLECDEHPQNSISTSAYIDSTESKVVVIAVNNSWNEKDQTFIFQNGAVEMVTPYVTSETKDCLQESAISIADSSFSATLEGKSITTFVSSGNVTVGVEHPPANKVSSFSLSQNYPNPFNPSTRINFEIPNKTFVSLKVYNLLGEAIKELAGKEYSPGAHSVKFDASYLSNGVYFYTLRTTNFKETKKMFVIK